MVNLVGCVKQWHVMGNRSRLRCDRHDVLQLAARPGGPGPPYPGPVGSERLSQPGLSLRPPPQGWPAVPVVTLDICRALGAPAGPLVAAAWAGREGSLPFFVERPPCLLRNGVFLP